MKTLILGLGVLGLSLASGSIDKNTALTLDSLFQRSDHLSRAAYMFSGATSDTVNFVRLCDLGANCNTGACAGPYLDIHTGTPLDFNTSYNISSQAITAFLQRNNAFAGTYHVGMLVRSTHRTCTSSTKHCSTSNDNVDEPLCMQATYNGTTLTGLTQNDNGNAVLNQPSSQYGYVADFNGNVYKCAVDTDGVFSSCPAPALPTGASVTWQPSGLAFETVNGTQSAYVADQDSSGGLWQCALNTSGVLTACAKTPSAGAPSWHPVGVTFANVGGIQFAYVVNNNQDTYVCTLNADGSFSSCSVTLSSAAVEAMGLDFATSISSGIATQRAYVAANNNGLQKCEISSGDGTLVSCGATPTSGAPAWTPAAIAIATVGSSQFAYVADNNSGNVYKCTVGTTGEFSACAVTPDSAPPWSSSDFRGVRIAKVNGSQFAYVTDNTATAVWKCTVHSTNGTFSDCAATPASAPAWSPFYTNFGIIDGA